MKVNKPVSQAQKSTQSTVDVIRFSKEEAAAWAVPGFQRPLRVNDKVKELAVAIRNDGGVIPGFITFGILKAQPSSKFLIDGQMRREAFLIADKNEGYADARFCFFDTYGEMANEFVRLNSHLVNMTPDDILRGLEPVLPHLQTLRRLCPFVGYGNIRRNENTALVSASSLLRGWEGSAGEAPRSGGKSAQAIAESLTADAVKHLANYCACAHTAWGNAVEYSRLWGGINMTLCMWLYRRTVMSQHSHKTVPLTDDLFTKCLMSLSASAVYLDWLVGRRLGEHDRSPAYQRIKAILSDRILAETGKKANLPQPPWSHGR